MKAITEPQQQVRPNNWGVYQTTTVQIFEVEAKDVGQLKQHMGGFHHGRHVFTEQDVGRRLQVLSCEAWLCWTFEPS